MNKQGGLRSQDYFSRRRNLKELLHFKGDEEGHIEGKVFMIWPPRNRLHRINLEVVEDSALYRFELEVPHSNGITFRPHERIRLALKGMRVDRRKESSAPHCFPIVLRFPDGVVLQYLTGPNAGRVVNTWAGKCISEAGNYGPMSVLECTENTDEWYNPGMVHTVSDAVTIDASGIHHGSVPTTTYPPVSTPPRRDVNSCYGEGVKVDQHHPSLIVVADGAATAQSMPPAQQPRTERPSRSLKGRARKKRRTNKGKEPMFPDQITNDANGPRPADVATPCHGRPQTSTYGYLANVSDSYPNLYHVGRHTNEEASVREDNGIDHAHKDNNINVMAVPGEANVPAPPLKAGFRTQRGDIFAALSDLQAGHSMINVIGIVTSVTPEKKTRTNEWVRSFTLVDPSIVGSARQSIKVNSFQKKYVEWLPQVQRDDIVILRKLKVVEFGGVVAATGYSDKLRWAVYDPTEHSIRPPNKGNAPEKESIDDGMGYEFSPYWEPFQDSTELEYCRQIGEWWRAHNEFEGQNVSTVGCSGPLHKQHLLISEASPDHPPKGFFNCTVEVLKKFNNHDSVTTVYVTDYTANALAHSVQAAWCPPELSDRVLQCNMWDDAKNIAKMMNPGEYWYLHNIRARWNPSHYMEGTMQLAEKVVRLDETKIEPQLHLRALLARKKEFESNTCRLTSESTSSHIFPEMLLQDVEGSTSFLTCIVELLHIDLNSREGHFIYVTDYTYNPDLPTTLSTADWAYNLEHRVVKIQLDDDQVRITPNLRSGSMHIIHNLRIKRPNVSGGVLGCLGGEDTLIISLHDSSSHHAQTLQRNKEKWRREIILNPRTPPPDGSHGEAHGSLRQSSPTLCSANFQELLAKPAPNTFKVLARAMDFSPYSLEDACVLRCTKCESSPPPSFKRCPRCDDMMETYSKWFYRLYVLLQDQTGSELIVSLSGKECMLLQDVDPTDFRCDRVTFREFLSKLDPILGNLRDVHAAWSRNEHKVIESPLMTFTLESWSIGDERGYSLLDYVAT